ncbi:hypothetical protein FHT80_002238 [Rhizobium sp. BK226]|nr:hypothetical protein [Rhizobium sp. BK226]
MSGDPEIPRDDILQLGNIGLGLLDNGEYPVGMHNQPPAGRCQRHPSPTPLDQRNSDFILQLGDLLGNGRGRNAERIGNRGHRLTA